MHRLSNRRQCVQSSASARSSVRVSPITTRRLTLALAVLAVTVLAVPVSAGTKFLDLNFDNGQGLPTVGTAATIVNGVGLGGSRALKFDGNLDFEVFWNIKTGGAPFTSNDGLGVLHLSYHNFIPQGNDTFFFVSNILTYSDANKSVVNGQDSYAPLSVVRHQPTNFTVATHSAWAQLFINQRNVATAVPTGVWQKVDYYVKLFDGTSISDIPRAPEAGGPVPTQAFGRIQNTDQTSTFGAIPLDGSLVSDYTGIRVNNLTYTRREARALQLFSFGESQFYDNLSIGTVDSTDIDLALRDVLNNVVSRRSDYDGSNTLTSNDSRVYVNQILDVRFGDSNLDRVVNSADGSTFLANFTNLSARWATGDSTGDDRVDIQDLRLVVRNFG